MAFFSPRFYADVASNWKGCGAVYLLFIIAVSTLINALGVGYVCYKAVSSQETRSFLMQLPKMTLTDGKISIDKPYPYNMKDLTGAYTIATFVKERDASELNDSDPPIIVTSNSVLMRNSGPSGPNIFTPKQLSELSTAYPKMVIDGTNILSTINTGWVFVPMAMFAAGVPFLYIGHLLQLLIYGGIAMAIGGMMAKKLKFQTGMRLAAMALTPCIFIATALNLLSAAGLATTIAPLSNIWPIAAVAVAIGYLCLACNAIEPPAETTAVAGQV